jgi:UDP-3-O-[3-hydroxymyristoyl] glucosamine N-acyltransferase
MSVNLFLYGKTRTGDFHAFGGGFVESTASVDPMVFLGPMVKVIDNAVLYKGTRVVGQSIVSNNAVVGRPEDASKITDSQIQQGLFFVLISQQSVVRDNTQVYNESQKIETPVMILGYSRVKDNAIIKQGTFKDQAVIRDNTVVPVPFYLPEYFNYKSSPINVTGENG